MNQDETAQLVKCMACGEASWFCKTTCDGNEARLTAGLGVHQGQKGPRPGPRFPRTVLGGSGCRPPSQLGLRGHWVAFEIVSRQQGRLIFAFGQSWNEFCFVLLSWPTGVEASVFSLLIPYFLSCRLH